MLGNIFRPRISGDNSIITSLATVAVVVAIYQAKIGPVSDVHATAPNDGMSRHRSAKQGGNRSASCRR